MVKLTELMPDGLCKVTAVHQQHVVNQAGTITLAEVDARLPEAAELHAREWERTTHPLDSALDPRVHDWAIRHIALNLVARDRGVRIGGVGPMRMVMPAARKAPELTPAGRTSDWRDR
jgi:hypothetical protein